MMFMASLPVPYSYFTKGFYLQIEFSEKIPNILLNFVNLRL